MEFSPRKLRLHLDFSSFDLARLLWTGDVIYKSIYVKVIPACFYQREICLLLYLFIVFPNLLKKSKMICLLKTDSNLRSKVLALVQIFKAESVVPNELKTRQLQRSGRWKMRIGVAAVFLSWRLVPYEKHLIKNKILGPNDQSVQSKLSTFTWMYWSCDMLPWA